MRLAFFGSSLVSAYWNGAATYYRGVLRALWERGHTATFYEPDAFDRQAHRDLEDPPYARVVVYAPTEAAADRCLAEAASADVVIKASGVGVLDGHLEAAVLALQRPGRRIVFWDVDAPATLERLEADAADPFLPLIPRYDLVLTYGGGDPVVRAYTARGARRCVPIYNAVDPTTHHPVPERESLRADLVFLGNRLPDREARVEEFFFKPARLQPQRRFLLGGSGWEPHALPPNVRLLGHVSTADHNALNVSSRAVLNISRESMARFGFSPATRVFEAAGAGACLITDAWEGIAQFLEPEQEVLLARTGEEVALLLEQLPPQRAQALGRAALRRVCSEHTYAHRAAELERILLATPTPESRA
jgi:spore maturation protein CgeB